MICTERLPCCFHTNQLVGPVDIYVHIYVSQGILSNALL